MIADIGNVLSPSPVRATVCGSLNRANGSGASSPGRVIVLTATRTANDLGLSVPTVNAASGRLEEAGILREVAGRRRGRLFVYDVASPCL
jgi:hypothetical protein